MISSLTLTEMDAEKYYWKQRYILDVPAWKERNYTFQFQPGLNIILGPNGSGKSSIIGAIAKHLCCFQGGIQKVTGDCRPAYVHPASPFPGTVVDHTGDPVMYVDSSKQVGLIGGAFDDDFFGEGLQETMFNGSHGQTTMRRLEGALAVLVGKSTAPPVPVHKDYPQLQGNGQPTGKVTILLDEPEKSLDLPIQTGFFSKLGKFVEKTGAQVILVTHSPLALYLKNAHVIELKAGYAETCKTHLDWFLFVRE